MHIKLLKAAKVMSSQGGANYYTLGTPQQKCANQ